MMHGQKNIKLWPRGSDMDSRGDRFEPRLEHTSCSPACVHSVPPPTKTPGCYKL